MIQDAQRRPLGRLYERSYEKGIGFESTRLSWLFCEAYRV